MSWDLKGPGGSIVPASLGVGQYTIEIEADKDCSDKVDVDVYNCQRDIVDVYTDIAGKYLNQTFGTTTKKKLPGNHNYGNPFMEESIAFAEALCKQYESDLVNKTKNFADPCWGLCLSTHMAQDWKKGFEGKGSKCWKDFMDKATDTNNKTADGKLEPGHLGNQLAFMMTNMRDTLACHYSEDFVNALLKCGPNPCWPKDVQAIKDTFDTTLAGRVAGKTIKQLASNVIDDAVKSAMDKGWKPNP